MLRARSPHGKGRRRTGTIATAAVLAFAAGGCAYHGHYSHHGHGGHYGYSGSYRTHSGGGDAGILLGALALFYIIADACH